MSFLRLPESFVRVLECLPRVLVPRLVVPLFVLCRGGAVRMGGHIVVLRGFLV